MAGKTGLVVGCGECRMYLRQLAFALKVRAQVLSHMERWPSDLMVNSFCVEHDRYLARQRAYAAHLAGHWAIIGKRRLARSLAA